MKKHDTIAVLDFGGQYAHLIANRIRRLGVYSEIVSNDTPAEELRRHKGIVLSGGPSSVLDPKSPSADPRLFSLGIPVLGLCYGHQLIAKLLGGSVRSGSVREYGIAQLSIEGPCELFDGLDKKQQIWMSHGDTVERLPAGFAVVGTTDDCATAAVADAKRRLYGLQFHPEVTDTPHGMEMLEKFLAVCGAEESWSTERFIEEVAEDIKARCGGRKVFLLVSGGVDSTVAFTLLNRILGPEHVLGLHIDNGLMRKNESEAIGQFLGREGFHNLRVVDASDEFLSALKGVVDPEEKRTIIGRKFVQVQEKAQADLGLNSREWILAQGTIYPDTIESAGTRHADKIKTHHNRVDVILELLEKGLVIEPLSQLYKDEVRLLGERLGLPHNLVWRHPFPGPGLGVRCLCSDGAGQSSDRETVVAVERIASEAGFHGMVLPVRSVGVQGDSRTYAHPAVLVGPRDYAAIEEASTRITNRVRGINRVVFAVGAVSSSYRPVKAELSRQRLDLLREADDAVTQVLRERNVYDDIWQFPVVLLPLADERGGQCVVLRPVKSQEAMTARFVPLSPEVLGDISVRIGAIDGLGSLFLDVTNKPPATIEWE